MVEMKFGGMDFRCALSSFPEKDCVLPLISKLLGYFLVAASTTVKLPQIMKIVENSSVKGLSVVGFELDVVGYTIALAYCLHKGLPFSAYGELAFLLIQAISRYCAIAPMVLAGKIDPMLFEALYACQHLVFFCARVPQIWANFKNKSTGELSFLTSLMNFAGSMVRVFTSMQEKAPMSVVLGSMKSFVMNAAILSQIIVYRKPAAKKEKKCD
ncbi:mannose-P-dolichol utilization defect 1 protein homolog 2-like isoform X3 [Salvia hispanica]|uniref:mannose-P-dolichol utilization defect 1 protein homolog 2-like isoform X3 n=1 Tax=Salvia hispanica TaxID=49212 RepID=UPI00200965E6|nr:mannose-P-dolichol utilization defect 1 protein homolog 2-like isoform X3 [Salvia hispanica]